MGIAYRVCVLECDQPHPPVLEKRGPYGQIFGEFLQQGLQDYRQQVDSSNDVQLELSSVNVVQDTCQFPGPTEVDCILLTGSESNAFEDHPWILKLVEYVRNVRYNTSTTIIGICFGHQVLARALGGTVARNDRGWEYSICRADLTPLGKSLFGQDQLELPHGHRDRVYTLPTDGQLVGSSDVCPIQGFCIPDRVLTLQGHPEFDHFMLKVLLERRLQTRLFSQEQYDDGMARCKQHSGPAVGVSFWKFLFQAQQKKKI